MQDIKPAGDYHQWYPSIEGASLSGLIPGSYSSAVHYENFTDPAYDRSRLRKLQACRST